MLRENLLIGDSDLNTCHGYHPIDAAVLFILWTLKDFVLDR